MNIFGIFKKKSLDSALKKNSYLCASVFHK